MNTYEIYLPENRILYTVNADKLLVNKSGILFVNDEKGIVAFAPVTAFVRQLT